jgi:hypothetical protein
MTVNPHHYHITDLVTESRLEEKKLDEITGAPRIFTFLGWGVGVWELSLWPYVIYVGLEKLCYENHARISKLIST